MKGGHCHPLTLSEKNMVERRGLKGGRDDKRNTLPAQIHLKVTATTNVKTDLDIANKCPGYKSANSTTPQRHQERSPSSHTCQHMCL